LVCLVPNNNDCQDTLEQLRSNVNEIRIFISVNRIFTLSAIYILCDNKAIHEERVKQWPKIKDIHTDIISISEASQKAAK